MEILSVIQLLAALLALGFCYPLILGSHNRKIFNISQRVAAIGALICTSISLAILYAGIDQSLTPFRILSLISLTAALGSLLIVVMGYRFHFTQKLKMQLLTYIAFGGLLGHILLSALAFSTL